MARRKDPKAMKPLSFLAGERKEVTKAMALAAELKREQRRAKPKSERQGTFKKGHAKVGGRQKGTPNKVTVLIRDAIISAAEASGYDTTGTEGMHGYLKRLADIYPKTFAPLLARMLPMQVNHSGDLNVRLTKEQLEKEIEERGLPKDRFYDALENLPELPSPEAYDDEELMLVENPDEDEAAPVKEREDQ